MNIILPLIAPDQYAEFLNLCPELPQSYKVWLEKTAAWKRHYQEPEYRVQWVTVQPTPFKTFLLDGSKPSNLSSLLAFATSVAGV